MTREDRRLARLRWMFVLVANLIVPVPLGLLRTDFGGRIGMGLAILAYWAVGREACSRSQTIGRVVNPGGAFFCLSQIFLLPQVTAGSLALAAWSMIVGEGEESLPDVSGVTEGFVVTILTAGLLLTATVACGLFIRGLMLLYRGVFLLYGEAGPAPQEQVSDHAFSQPIESRPIEPL